MLQLQRASAGSGKTYTLAKKFIWYLITIKDNTPGGFRLRNEQEISDVISRILAITFTNKATTEMKERIVKKLAALAEVENQTITSQLIKDTDYLDEFASELNVSHQEIGKVCKLALSVILNQYSDFNVSTIDSFFQTVLRTFAYESNLNDSYQVEIDSDYIISAAIDATLDEVNTSLSGTTNSSFWISLLMNDSSSETGAVWNVFQKNNANQSIYSKLRDSLKKMENEEFKEKRGKLDEYLLSDKGASRLIEAYVKIRSDIENELTSPFESMKRKAHDIQKLLRSNDLNAAQDCVRWFDSHLKKILKYKLNTNEKKWFKPINLSGGKSILKKGVICSDESALTVLAHEMYDSFEEWCAILSSEKHKLWKIYFATLPYLGLLLDARDKISSFLDTNNLIQLGETNSILNRIIGDSDAPFIYERLGARLNHYLIDEFQDTSDMQWQNLEKLLRESDSRGEDNLIIGDAKQSIYRFRNANPALITSVVPENFADSIKLSGMSKADNTNWRSYKRIVEFNNFFFQALAKEITKIQNEIFTGVTADIDKIDFNNLYSNVVQYPKHQEDEGYIEIRFFDGVAKNDIYDQAPVKSEEVGGAKSNALREIGPLITDLISRGYKQKDIALLVDTKRLGNEVVEALIEYNATLSDEMPKIEFLSEDSLLISSSEAVETIISTLQKMSQGIPPSETSNTGHDKDTENIRINWNDIKSDYSFFALQHPELKPSQLITEFLNIGKPIDTIREMLRDMQTVALPSLVESIVEKFVPKNLRKTQAVFIAAFQDLVLDYCERHAADLTSFLEWWKSRGIQQSISSPEGTDAVSILTIHKSKGLEFKCVIIPFEDNGVMPHHSKKEWRWVKPSEVFQDYDLPEWIPIETTKDLLATEYADIYRHYCDMYMMDKLNSLYVAFTRAECELYIFTKNIDTSNKTTNNSAWFIKNICSNIEDYLPENMTDIISPDQMTTDETHLITFGEKPLPKSEEYEQTTQNRKSDVSFKETKIIEEYGVNSCPTILHCLDNDILAEEALTTAELLREEVDDSATVAPETSDTDPRSEGNLLHSIMENVKVPGDLHRAVLTLKMRGIISSQQSEEWEPMLRKAMNNDNVKDWFDRKWRVLNERNIIQKDKTNKRPDRILISSDGKEAIIIDYKFGEAPKDEQKDLQHKLYLKQVSGYAFRLRDATGIRHISPFIWYVKSGKIYRANF